LASSGSTSELVNPCIPRNVEHAWTAVSTPTKIINAYQPAGKVEEFFQMLAKFKDLPSREQAIAKSYTAEQIDGLKRVFEAHGMIVTGPPLGLDSNGSRRRRAKLLSSRDEVSRVRVAELS
jgi:hypothetical protein